MDKTKQRDVGRRTVVLNLNRQLHAQYTPNPKKANRRTSKRRASRSLSSLRPLRSGVWVGCLFDRLYYQSKNYTKTGGGRGPALVSCHTAKLLRRVTIWEANADDWQYQNSSDLLWRVGDGSIDHPQPLRQITSYQWTLLQT